jgi:hypothetical protein
MTQNGIAALYFPYSRPLAVSTLKKSVLIFDELIFLDHLPWFVRQAILDTKNDTQEPVAEALDYLMGEDFVKIVDPRPQLKEFDLLLTLNVASDMKDPEYLRASISDDVSAWSVLRDRLPATFLDFFYPGAGTFSESISLQALIKAGGRVEEIRDERDRKFAEFRWSGISSEEALAALVDRYSMVVGGNPHMELKSYEVPSLQASSLRIAEALLHCSESGRIPFTDSDAHKRLLALKTVRAEGVLQGSDALPLDIPFERDAGDARLRDLEIRLLEMLLPAQELERRTVRELLEYRRSHGEALERMRASLAQVADSMQEGPLSSSVETDRLIRSKILPEIQKARNDFLEEYEKNMGYITAKSAMVVGGALTASLLGGLNAWQILGACAAAEAGYLTTKGNELLVDNWRAIRRRKRSAYAYFTELRAT